VAAVAVLLIVGLGAAVSKPWDAPVAEVALPVASGPSSSLPGPSAAGTRSPTPTVAPSPPSPLPGLPPLPATTVVARLIEYRDAWGVRAIVGRSQFAERWAAVPEPLPDGAPSPREAHAGVLVVRPAERPVRLLGLTTPAGVEIGRIEVGVARADGLGGLAFRGTETLPWRGRTLLFLPPSGEVWDAGTYQFRVEVGDATTAISVEVLDRGASMAR
jgi:hypothetical protein